MSRSANFKFLEVFMIEVKIKRVRTPLLTKSTRLTNEALPLPTYQSPSAAGMDLLADIEEPLTLQKGQRMAVPTGIAISLPLGFEAQVRPRSGLALKKGVTLLNSPGTIDADYRGEIKVIVINLGEEPFLIERGDRIAQLIVSPVIKANLVLVNELDGTDRSSNGFGSTGV